MSGLSAAEVGEHTAEWGFIFNRELISISVKQLLVTGGVRMGFSVLNQTYLISKVF